MIYHRHLPATPTPTFPGVQEVARWPEPTRVLVLTDKTGTRRLRVEMMASDVTSAALEGLVVVLEIIEAARPEPSASSGASSAVEPLQLVAAPDPR